jgi:RimJ/RimL family protein N-acetyltransferase
MQIETDRLILRHFEKSDVDSMFRNWASNPDVVRFLVYDVCETIKDTKNLIDEWFHYFESAHYAEVFAITLKSDGEVIGTIDFVQKDGKTRSAEVGYQIGKLWWGCGYVAEALRAVIKHCFETVGLTQLWADCDVENVNSKKVMKKAGMIHEGVSENRVMYSIYAEEKQMEIKTLRQKFKVYMQERFPNDSNISSTVSMAFFSTKHGGELGIDFQRILTNRIIPETYKEVLEKHFEKRGRKNPRSDAAVYTRALRLLLEFLDGKQYTAITPQSIKHKPNNRIAKAEIPRPTNQIVAEYLGKWELLTDYVEQEKALNLLFHETFPRNISISEVLIKCSTLNDFYSTNIFKIHPVAEHIIRLNLDLGLVNGDLQLVNDISSGHGIKNKKGRELNLFSFATKYCSHHNSEDFPIFDSYVEKVIIHFKNKDRFSDFNNNELRNFVVFKQAIIDFRDFYQLNEFRLKQIDQYLWLLGKEYFPKQYRGKQKGYSDP